MLEYIDNTSLVFTLDRENLNSIDKYTRIGTV